MKKISLYAVPDPAKVSGGPRVRITGIAEALRSKNNSIIIGKNVEKFLSTIRLPKTDVLYVESSTNRLKILDILCLLVWRYKSQKIVVYIRDVYIELFPEEYRSLRGSVTKVANKISNFFYCKIADRLAFPTIEMGEEFFVRNSSFPKKDFFAFPPGTFLPFGNNDELPEEEIGMRINPVKLLYLGGTTYKNSGFEDFLKLAKRLGNRVEFHILTNDSVEEKLEKIGVDKNCIKVLTVPHSQVMEYIRRERITFAVHSRPRNLYDDITYPIKFMDFISCLLPPLTLKHKPILSLLGEEYPFYLDSFDAVEIERCINIVEKKPEIYRSSLAMLKEIRADKLYTNQIKYLENS
jgi:hypothetical protein